MLLWLWLASKPNDDVALRKEHICNARPMFLKLQHLKWQLLGCAFRPLNNRRISLREPLKTMMDGPQGPFNVGTKRKPSPFPLTESRVRDGLSIFLQYITSVLTDSPRCEDSSLLWGYVMVAFKLLPIVKAGLQFSAKALRVRWF